MDVYGYDPFLSVDTALRLDRHVHVVKDINDLYKRADYVTMHIHYTEKTAHMINADAIGAMKRGVRVINLARGEIVDDEAMLAALGGPCLLLFDEFGRRWRLWRGVRRSTSVECGMALGW